MEKTFGCRIVREQVGRLGLIAGIVGITTVAAAQGWQLSSNVTFKADLTLKETFDSNVYMQDREPSPTVTNAARPFQESLVTSVTPRVGIEWRSMKEFSFTAYYAPEINTYHAEPSESHVAHRGSLLFNGVVGIVTWQMQNSLTWIDGSEEGLTFGGPGGAPAIGGIPIRDRRAALIYRNSFAAFHKHGDWFFRPAISSYIHDFMTTERNPSAFPFYQNYVDRNDFNVGLDAGYQVFKDGYVFLGYRFGWQREPPLPGQNIDYSNDYQRLLAGFEGKITGWLKLNLFIGPDWRDFNHHTPSGFQDHQVKLFVDGSMVITPTKSDSLILTAKQFEQPAFGTPSAYEDITYDVTWRHTFSSKLAATAGFRAYGGAWEKPVLREDWIFTPSASLAYKHDAHWSTDLSYSYDWADSLVPGKAGREFTRHLLSLGLKYAF
jgi:hypothetical protein